MRPITSFSAMILWAILLIAIAGIVVNLVQSMWVPSISWAILTAGTTACLTCQRLRRTDSLSMLKHTRAQRVQHDKKNESNHT